MVGQMICCLLLRRANLDPRKPEILTDIALVGHREVYDFYFAPNSKDLRLDNEPTIDIYL